MPGEPYTVLQTSLQSQFPDRLVLVSPLSKGALGAYVMPRDKYGIGLYQEEATTLAPGTLENLIDAVAATVPDVGAKPIGENSAP